MSLLSDLASFPKAGPFSIGGYSAPRNSGLVPVTELRNILDDSWSRKAADRAVSLAGRGGNGTLGCLTSNGLWNAASGALGVKSGSGYSLPGLGSFLNASGGSLKNVVGDLQMASSIQSLAAGLAKSNSMQAGTMFALLDRALSAPAGQAASIMGIASSFMASASKTTDLFAGAFDLGGKGLLGNTGGAFSPGEIFSGEAGLLSKQCGFSSSLLDLTGDSLLTSNALGGLGIDALLPPTASFNDLSNVFGPVEGGLSEEGQDVGSAISDLNDDTLAKVGAAIGDTLSDALDAIEEGITAASRAMFGSEDEDTVDRYQGIQMVDGEWNNGYQISKGALVGLSAILGVLAMKTKSSKLKSLFGIGAAGVLLATLLGNSAPVSGSYLLNSNGGWLGSGSATRGGVTNSLAEACAFNAALTSALAGFLKSGTTSIDALMAALECRRSSYDRMYGSAYGSQLNTDYMLQRLMSLLGVVNGGQYPGLCSSSTLGLGRCL